MTIESDKKRFMCYELGLLSLKGALSTRDDSAPIYAKGVASHQRKKEKRIFRAVLDNLESLYANGNVPEEQHFNFIQKTSDEVSRELGAKLHNGRFRIGVTQKLINLHLKYLWAAGFISEPPHCPIDGIIRDKAKISYDWTTSDSLDEYMTAIHSLKKVSGNRRLAVWELEEFRRRDEV